MCILTKNRRMAGQGKSWHFVLKEDHRCKFYNLFIQNSPRNLNRIFINSNSYHYLADFHETLIRVPNQNRQEICFFTQCNKNQTRVTKTAMDYKDYKPYNDKTLVIQRVGVNNAFQ